MSWQPLEASRSLGEEEPALGVGDRPPELAGGLDPLADHDLSRLEGGLVRRPVRGAAWELGDLRDERLVRLRPVQDDFVAVLRLHRRPPRRAAGPSHTLARPRALGEPGRAWPRRRLGAGG